MRTRRLSGRSPRPAVTALFATAAACAPPPPEFYRPPDALPARPGDVIRTVKTSFGSATNVGATAVSYRSTTATGRPNYVTGTLLVPKPAWTGAGRGRSCRSPPGTQGVGDSCASSTAIPKGTSYQQQALRKMLDQGWAVAVTDYEGIGTPGDHLRDQGRRGPRPARHRAGRPAHPRPASPPAHPWRSGVTPRAARPPPRPRARGHLRTRAQRRRQRRRRHPVRAGRPGRPPRRPATSGSASWRSPHSASTPPTRSWTSSRTSTTRARPAGAGPERVPDRRPAARHRPPHQRPHHHQPAGDAPVAGPHRRAAAGHGRPLRRPCTSTGGSRTRSSRTSRGPACATPGAPGAPGSSGSTTRTPTTSPAWRWPWTT